MKSFALPAASLLFLVVISMQLENGSVTGTTTTIPSTKPTIPTQPSTAKVTAKAGGGAPVKTTTVKGASNAPVAKGSTNAPGGVSPVSTKPPATKVPSYAAKLTKGCMNSATKDCFKTPVLASASCKDVKAQEKCLTKDHTVCKAKDFTIIKDAKCFCPRTVASALMIAVLCAFAKMLGQ